MCQCVSLWFPSDLYFFEFLLSFPCCLCVGAAELFTPKAANGSAACCNHADHLLSCVSGEVNADILFTGQDISINGVKLSFSNPIEPHGKVYKNELGDESTVHHQPQ